MSDKSLYRVFRPKTFNDVIGQDFLVKTLKNSILQNKSTHAYLFTGPRGTGKTSLAKIMAKALNCLNLDAGNPCNVCEACKTINEGNSFEVLELDAASNRGVDDIRSIIDNIKIPPTILKKKVFIIDEVHMLTTQAFNALLKTLEEPPRDVVFILATTEYHKLPSTIVSRCQRYSFSSIDNNKISNLIKDIATKSKINIDKPSADLIAKLSKGGARDAISILEQVSTYTKNINVDSINEAIGALPTDQISELLVKLKTTSDLPQILNEIKTKTINVEKICDDIIHIIRDCIVALVTGTNTHKVLASDNDIKLITSNFGIDDLYYISDVIIECFKSLKNSGSAWEIFEIHVIKISTIRFNKFDNQTNIKFTESPIETAEDDVVSHDDFELEIEEDEDIVDDIQSEISEPEEAIEQIEESPVQEPEIVAQEAPIEEEIIEETIEEKPIEMTPEPVHVKEEKSLEQKLSDLDFGNNRASIFDDTSVTDRNDNVISLDAETTTVIDLIGQTSLEETKVLEVSNVNNSIKIETIPDFSPTNADVLNYLVQADRDSIAKFKKRWSILAEYRNNSKTSKAAATLLKGKIVSATLYGILVEFNSQGSADVLNANIYNKNFMKFVWDVMGRKVTILGIGVELWDNVKGEYIKLRQANRLPKPKPIRAPEFLEDNDDFGENLKNVFGNLVEE